MLQVDMKGWIPHQVVNAFMARAPKSWLSSLSDYYWNVYSKRNQEEGQQQTETKEKPAE